MSDVTQKERRAVVDVLGLDGGVLDHPERNRQQQRGRRSHERDLDVGLSVPSVRHPERVVGDRLVFCAGRSSLLLAASDRA